MYRIFSPDLVAFSSTTHQYPIVERCARWIKESEPELLTIAGGTHITLVPEEVIVNPDFDFICIGEGEYPLLDLANALKDGRDITNIRNLWLHKDGRLIRNPMRPLLGNLDELPFADRELFDFKQILADNGGWADMMVGRGCPYMCSYCCNPALRERFTGLGKYVRFRSVENVLAEIRLLAKHYNVKTLNFQDDVFTLDKEWTMKFCKAYEREFNFPFWINTRVERISDEEMVSALADAGCCGVRIGIESGNENLREKILKRRMSNDEIRQAFALGKKHGLKIYTCNMLGIPGETASMIEETIALNRELDPADLQFTVFYPYPMTELYDVSVQEGYLTDEESHPSLYGPKSVLHLPTLSDAELQQEYDHFQQLRSELHMKGYNATKYRVYKVLCSVFGGDADKAWSVMHTLERIKSYVGSLGDRK